MSKIMTIAAIAGVLVLSIALAVAILPTPAYAHQCDSSDVPPFKDLPDAADSTGNPHTCQQPTGDPHDDEDNPEIGNPHNVED
jgi:hypothetical protein